jgi:hypothetical protein
LASGIIGTLMFGPEDQRLAPEARGAVGVELLRGLERALRFRVIERER